MFGGTNSNELDFLWLDGKKHVVKISEGDTNIDIFKLHEQYMKKIEEKEELCKNIYFLGVGLTGSAAAARGFVYGWLVKSIRDSVEKSGRSRWKIEHESIDISEEEARNHIASELETIAKRMREDEDYKVKKTPIIRGDENDDLFQ